jgi:hypothetical protein
MSHWPINVFKLASPGDAHGVACDGEGAFVGAIPLLEERGDVWCIRSVVALNIRCRTEQRTQRLVRRRGRFHLKARWSCGNRECSKQ